MEDLANAILELCLKDFQGTIHLGPQTKASYYTFFKTRFRQLGIDPHFLFPIIDNHSPIDTSPDTRFAHSILGTSFREL